MEKRLKSIINQIKKRVDASPSVAIILGSGLGDFAAQIQNKTEISYSSLKGMPTSTVAGHSGKFIFGEVEGVSVVAMQGRFHLYEGYSAKEVTLPIYIFQALCVKTLLVTNAAGAVNKDYVAGDLMIITDQINLTGQNPLIGGPIVDFGVKFVDMMNAYDKDYVEALQKIGENHKLDLKTGTYIQFLGPTYETPAEVKMARAVGADAVGMSTTVEVVAAVQAGLRVAGISAIANMAVGITDNAVTHEEVLAVMQGASGKLKLLVTEFIKTLV